MRIKINDLRKTVMVSLLALSIGACTTYSFEEERPLEEDETQALVQDQATRNTVVEPEPDYQEPLSTSNPSERQTAERPATERTSETYDQERQVDQEGLEPHKLDTPPASLEESAHEPSEQGLDQELRQERFAKDKTEKERASKESVSKERATEERSSEETTTAEIDPLAEQYAVDAPERSPQLSEGGERGADASDLESKQQKQPADKRLNAPYNNVPDNNVPYNNVAQDSEELIERKSAAGSTSKPENQSVMSTKSADEQERAKSQANKTEEDEEANQRGEASNEKARFLVEEPMEGRGAALPAGKGHKHEAGKDTVENSEGHHHTNHSSPSGEVIRHQHGSYGWHQHGPGGWGTEPRETRKVQWNLQRRPDAPATRETLE